MDVSPHVPERREDREGPSVGRRLLNVCLVGGVVVGGYLFVVSVLPRWWSHRVGDQVDGDLTTGALLGFVYGFVCTFLPLLVLGIVWAFRRRSALAWILGACIAILLAAPNLVLLGITIGKGNSAHAADRTLDVEAPWFRGGTVIGVAAAVVVVGFVAWVVASRARARAHARTALERLDANRRGREEDTPQPAEPRA